MRIVFFCSLFLWFVSYSRTNAQVVVDGIDINKLNITYCQLTAQNGKNKAQVWIDHGMPVNKSSTVTDSNGNPIDFGTVIDALNFMTSHGWELVSWQMQFTSDVRPDLRVVTFVYLLRKKLTN